MHSSDPIAERKAAKLERRQGLERHAVEAGQAYARHLNEVEASRQFVAQELMPAAAEAGIPIDALAKLIGVSRQTLYRWRDDLGPQVG